MPVKVAINGLGRIGRAFLRNVYENSLEEKINIVAINDIVSTENLSYLLSRDSVHGKFLFPVKHDDKGLFVKNSYIPVFSESTINSNLPWKDMGIDYVVESTGNIRSEHDIKKHLDVGAKKVLVTFPHNKFPMYIPGVNYLNEDSKIFSIGSCTGNALSCLIKMLDDTYEIENLNAITTHIHTVGQNILDSNNRDVRRMRSATTNIIPTTTEAMSVAQNIFPHLKEKIAVHARRVPVSSGSLIDVTALVKRKVLNSEELNHRLIRHPLISKNTKISHYTDNQPVSADISGSPYSVILDTELTNVIAENFVSISGWYDNEYGFANRMIDTILHNSKHHVS